MNRPKFGSQAKSNVFTNKEKSREEVGAIWKKRTKYNSDLLTIKINKEILEKLLKNNTESTVRLVAYENTSVENKQPNFRIFEDTK